MHSFPRAAVRKYHKLDALKEQKFVLSQFWRHEVQNQGVGRVIIPLQPTRRNPSLPLPSFWWRMAVFAIALLQSLPLQSHGFLLICFCLYMAILLSVHVCVQISLSL